MVHRKKKKKDTRRNILGFAWDMEEDSVEKLQEIANEMKKEGFKVRLKHYKKSQPPKYVLDVPRPEYIKAFKSYSKML